MGTQNRECIGSRTQIGTRQIARGFERNLDGRNQRSAEQAFKQTVARFGDKYPKAINKLVKDEEELLAFYDFPDVHWTHIRTTNPIESTFATVRLRSKRAKNCGSRETTLAMVYKLLETAQKRWRRIQGFNLLTLVVNNVIFKDGKQEDEQSTEKAA